MHLKFLRLALVLLLLHICSFSAARACSEYVHLWRPVAEARSEALAPEGIAVFLAQLQLRLPETQGKWNICVNPVSESADTMSATIASAVAILNSPKLVWHDALSPFSPESRDKAAIWLDIVAPEHQQYFWRDENKPPLAMFRFGEFDTATVRVMVRDSSAKIILIEEFKHVFLLESDVMLPSWFGTGGAWLRRISFQTGFRQKRIEYTFAVPPDQEEINAAPPDVIRFYFGESLPKDF